MRIAQIAPPFETVPPTRYGGTERVVATLTEELVRRGHEVTLFASGDSHTSARLVPVVERALWHDRSAYTSLLPFSVSTLGTVLRELSSFDVVHNHLDYLGFLLARAHRSPQPAFVNTLHGRLDLPELQALYREFDDAPLVSISDAQRRPLPRANWLATVHHGIELDQLTFNPEPGNYLAYLGRISPEKGLDAAIRIAKQTGWPLKIAARMPLPFKDDPNVRADWNYYEDVVCPLLDGAQIEMVGEVGGTEKDDFLRHAAALLFPINWPEPFGLVMPEALACGTPVLALRQGSVPEIVADGVTGFVRDTESELAAAVARIPELDRLRCRQEVERRFTPAAMAARYEAVYERAVRPAATTSHFHVVSSPSNGHRAPGLLAGSSLKYSD
ncbi:MAG: glycosyltransferase family 4 protein [Chloroflexi bacterium]|nr:glycosyltransferase family 4 protein [Chloroflexota bacterium]